MTLLKWLQKWLKKIMGSLQPSKKTRKKIRKKNHPQPLSSKAYQKMPSVKKKSAASSQRVRRDILTETKPSQEGYASQLRLSASHPYQPGSADAPEKMKKPSLNIASRRLSKPIKKRPRLQKTKDHKDSGSQSSRQGRYLAPQCKPAGSNPYSPFGHTSDAQEQKTSDDPLDEDDR